MLLHLSCSCHFTKVTRATTSLKFLMLLQVVLPFTHGEVAVQSYNLVLTLSSLYQNSDSIILSHNEEVVLFDIANGSSFENMSLTSEYMMELMKNSNCSKFNELLIYRM